MSATNFENKFEKEIGMQRGRKNIAPGWRHVLIVNLQSWITNMTWYLLEAAATDKKRRARTQAKVESQNSIQLYESPVSKLNHVPESFPIYFYHPKKSSGENQEKQASTAS